jgi:Ca2+/Na+ antiporter
MFVKLSRYLPGNPSLQGPSSMSNTKSTNIAIIIGPMLGGIFTLVIIICLVFFIKRQSHIKTKERALVGGHLQMMNATCAGKRLTIYIYVFSVIQQ